MEEEENLEHNLLWHLELWVVRYYECTVAAVIILVKFFIVGS